VFVLKIERGRRAMRAQVDGFVIVLKMLEAVIDGFIGRLWLASQNDAGAG